MELAEHERRLGEQLLLELSRSTQRDTDSAIASSEHDSTDDGTDDEAVARTRRDEALARLRGLRQAPPHAHAIAELRRQRQSSEAARVEAQWLAEQLSEVVACWERSETEVERLETELQQANARATAAETIAAENLLLREQLAGLQALETELRQANARAVAAETIAAENLLLREQLAEALAQPDLDARAELAALKASVAAGKAEVCVPAPEKEKAPPVAPASLADEPARLNQRLRSVHHRVASAVAGPERAS